VHTSFNILNALQDWYFILKKSATLRVYKRGATRCMASFMTA
jgi:hypothetical protein